VTDQPAWYPIEPPPRRRWLPNLLIAGGVAAFVAALGVPLGFVWSELAPRLQMVKFEGDLYFIDAGPEELAAADGWFIVLGVGVGLVVSLGAWFGLRRRRGPVMLAALAVGSLGSSALAAWIGSEIGRAAYEERLATAPDRTLLTLPLEVGATGSGWFGHLTGAIAIQALIAVFVYMIMAGWSRYPELMAPRLPAYPAYPPYPADGQLGPGLTGSSEMGTGTART
jgi:hypothetical protein